MQIDITKYDNPVIVEGEIERLQKLASLVLKDSVAEIKENLLNHKNGSRSGIYAEIECDINGFFELEQTITKSWVLRPKFRGLSRNQVRGLLLNRINSVKIGTVELPEGLFEIKTLRVEFQGRLIDVFEVARRPWDFILYKSIYYQDEFYVEIVFSKSFASWSKFLKLNENEVITANGGNEEEIEAMVENKRNENWS